MFSISGEHFLIFIHFEVNYLKDDAIKEVKMTTCNYTHPRNILVATLQRLYDYGMTTTSGGNISVKDNEGNIWITPGGIDKGSLRPDDIVKVTPDGKIIGNHRPSCELPFHTAVYSMRKDVRAVLHAHSPLLRPLILAVHAYILIIVRA